MIFNMEYETMPREALEAIQIRRLQATLSRVYATVPFYRSKFDQAGIKPGDIRSLSDMKHLPFTVKQDLRDNYPFGMFAVPMDNVVRIHASSGTTGQPTVVGYTARDIGSRAGHGRTHNRRTACWKRLATVDWTWHRFWETWLTPICSSPE